MITAETLSKYVTVEKKYTKNQLIFSENEIAKYFYQIKSGSIKMFNLTEDGKEFVQGNFEAGKSFGEPPLLGNFEYPASAAATSNTVLTVIPKDEFLKLLLDNPEIHLALTKNLCHRIHYKAIILKEATVHKVEHRIFSLLQHLKNEAKVIDDYEVKLTRQQISQLTGLRVETVIRAIKKLESSGKLKIINRKVIL